jgi:hypothetical protein
LILQVWRLSFTYIQLFNADLILGFCIQMRDLIVVLAIFATDLSVLIDFITISHFFITLYIIGVIILMN